MIGLPDLPYGCRLIAAGALAAEHIGSRVRFRTWDAAAAAANVVTGELRQISHDGQDTSITYGLLAELQVTLPHTALVVLDPDAEYGDMPRLIVANARADKEREEE